MFNSCCPEKHQSLPSVLSTALQPIQVLRFWANAMSPPTLEVSTVLQRVWSPSGINMNFQ